MTVGDRCPGRIQIGERLNVVDLRGRDQGVKWKVVRELGHQNMRDGIFGGIALLQQRQNSGALALRDRGQVDGRMMPRFRPSCADIP